MSERHERPRPVLGELSAEAKAARAPLRPEELVEAQHDRVHRDPGRTRAARTVRNSRALEELQACTHCGNFHWRKPTSQYDVVVHEYGEDVEGPFEVLRIHKVCKDDAYFAAEKGAEQSELGEWVDPPCDLRVLVRDIADGSVRSFRVESEAVIVYYAEEVE